MDCQVMHVFLLSSFSLDGILNHIRERERPFLKTFPFPQQLSAVTSQTFPCHTSPAHSRLPFSRLFLIFLLVDDRRVLEAYLPFLTPSPMFFFFWFYSCVLTRPLEGAHSILESPLYLEVPFADPPSTRVFARYSRKPCCGFLLSLLFIL